MNHVFLFPIGWITMSSPKASRKQLLVWKHSNWHLHACKYTNICNLELSSILDYSSWSYSQVPDDNYAKNTSFFLFSTLCASYNARFSLLFFSSSFFSSLSGGFGLLLVVVAVVLSVSPILFFCFLNIFAMMTNLQLFDMLYYRCIGGQFRWTSSW